MPDETTAALKALMDQVTSLTKVVEELSTVHTVNEKLKANNQKLTDELKDAQRAGAISPERLAELEKLGIGQTPDGRLVLGYGSGNDGHTLTREQARDPATYRSAREAAEKAGVALRIIDPNDDPTRRNTGKSDIATTRIHTIKDDHERKVYIRSDIYNSGNWAARKEANRRDGFTEVPWRSLDDLPAPMRMKLNLMEKANADS